MKYFLFLLAPLLLLLNAGCTSTTTPSTQQLPPPPNIFFNETNLPTGFVALLQTFSPDTLPHAQEIFPPEHIKTPIRMFTFQAIDFANADYPEAKFLPEHSDLKNSSFQLIFYNAYPVGLFQSRTPLGQYGAINQYGYNDYYVLLTSDDNHSEPQKTLYKNFEEIATGVVDYRLNTQNQLYLVKNEGVNDKGQPLNLILTKEGKLLEKMPATSGYVKPLLFDENDQLIYAVSVLDNEEAYANSTYFLKNERGEIIDSWTGNFLVGTETYTLQALETGFAIGRKYDERPNDIEESISTITPEILTEVQQQEKTLMKYYRLIDQQHFEEAYAMLKQPQLSLDAFRKQWNKYNLVDIDRIATPLIFFKSYPSTNTPYLEGIGQLNQFEVRLFMRTLSGTIEINREILRVSPSGIELLASEPMPIFHTLNTPKMLLVQLYYHLIASERFEEAYQMQYRHSQSLQAFQDTYKNVQGIAIHQMTDMRTLSKEDWESSSTDDKEEGEVQLLIDFITPKGNERYAIQKEVLNGKIKHLSSEATTK
ncbi:MAG: hypothetical protein LBP53_05320 [Candidatus Peribacteria bacterium]|jgi:hypothetical protein|nr:hypothetical protein [Candidatus Peribacteria bacterium]